MPLTYTNPELDTDEIELSDEILQSIVGGVHTYPYYGGEDQQGSDPE